MIVPLGLRIEWAPQANLATQYKEIVVLLCSGATMIGRTNSKRLESRDCSPRREARTAELVEGSPKRILHLAVVRRLLFFGD